MIKNEFELKKNYPHVLKHTSIHIYWIYVFIIIIIMVVIICVDVRQHHQKKFLMKCKKGEVQQKKLYDRHV